MNALLAAWWRLLVRIGNVERAVCVALLALIVVSITVQVFTRYVFGQPIVWVEEAAGYAFLWGTFVGAGLGFKEVRHIRIDTFIVRLAPSPQAIARALIYALVTGLAIVVAWYAWDIMDVESRSSTMALPVELPRSLFYSTPLFVGLASIVFTGCYLVLANLARARSGRPVEADADASHRRARMAE